MAIELCKSVISERLLYSFNTGHFIDEHKLKKKIDSTRGAYGITSF